MMRRDSVLIHQRIIEHLDKLQTEFSHEMNYQLNFFEKIYELPRKRNDKNIMRSTLTRLINNLCGGTETDSIEALTVSELNNINYYLDNWIFDNKNNVWGNKETRNRVSSITACSAIFRELTEKSILNISTSAENKIRILECLTECMIKSTEGQALDLELTIDEIDNFNSDEEYLRIYTKKAKMQSGYLYGLSAKIGAILANASEVMIERSEKIGQAIGIGIHIINDLGDFAFFKNQSNGFKAY